MRLVRKMAEDGKFYPIVSLELNSINCAKNLAEAISPTLGVVNVTQRRNLLDIRCVGSLSWTMAFVVDKMVECRTKDGGI
jgi:hypothetical protein